jgi:hypothetical protein
VDDAPGDVEVGADRRREELAVADELVLPLQDVEGLILFVMEVRYRPRLGIDRLLKQRERPCLG